MDLAYTDENVGELPMLGGAGEGSMGRLCAVLLADVVGIGIVRGGEKRVPKRLLFAEGGSGVRENHSINWKTAGGR